MSLTPEQIGRLAKNFEEIFKMALDRRGRPLRTVYSVAEAPRIQGNTPMTDSLSQHCPNCEAQAAEIEQLEREKAVVSDLWEQQKEITLDYLADCNKAADRIEAQAAEIVKLREALKEVFEAWAGSDGFIPETAPEGYLLYLTKRMAHIARAALGETK